MAILILLNKKTIGYCLITFYNKDLSRLEAQLAQDMGRCFRFIEAVVLREAMKLLDELRPGVAIA